MDGREKVVGKKVGCSWSVHIGSGGVFFSSSSSGKVPHFQLMLAQRLAWPHKASFSVLSLIFCLFIILFLPRYESK